MLVETKQLLFNHFDMKDIREVSYVLSIQILRNRANDIFRLSQHAYIERILKRFNIQSCSSIMASIVKGDRFSKCHCPHNVLGRYLSDLDQSHWKAAKKFFRYIQDTRDLVLTYWCTDTLEVVGFNDFDYASCVDDKKSTFGYIFMMIKGVFSWKSVKQTLTASLLWRLSMWRVIRLLVMQYGC